MDNPIPCAPASTASAAAGVVAAEAGAGARTVLVAGASGLVGREILNALSTDSRISAIHCVGRRPVEAADRRVVSHLVDFASLPALPAVDEVYIALGTTIAVAGSQQAFRAVDFESVVAVARAARAAGARHLGVVSAMGANPRSPIFYNRVKGEMEAALATLGYDTLVIARPSMLAGDRGSLGQPVRGGESLALALSTALRPLIPRNLRAIPARKVAQALVQAVQAARPGRQVLLSGAMQRSA